MKNIAAVGVLERIRRLAPQGAGSTVPDGGGVAGMATC